MTRQLSRRSFLSLGVALALVGCAGAEVEPTPALPASQPLAPPPPPTATPPTTVMVVVNGGLARAVEPGRQLSTRSERPIEIPTAVPTAVPTATPVPPTATPQPSPTPKGRTFPPVYPPDLVNRGDARWLPVPYRSQLDGNPYELADCGPASMAMVLAAYGKNVPTMEIRRLVNKLQGTEGMHDVGTLIENLHVVAERYGMKPSGLFAQKGFRKWTLAQVRQSIDAGKPIIPQVWYRGLPGREHKEYNGDHYVVLVGYVGDDFIYHDPIDKDGPGYSRRMSAAQLDRAWLNGDFPYAGVAIGGPAGKPSLLTS